MKLSDAAGASAAGANVAASADLDPSSAISAGSSLFDAAYQKAGGSITGTVAVAASVVADLPSGAAKQLLSTVVSIGSDIAAGAAMGSVIPGWGTAVGAAIGGIMGAFSAIESGAAQPPEGDIRSSAEQMVFPAVAATPGDTDPQSLLSQTSAQPVCWPDIRVHSAMFQVPINGTDPGSGVGYPAEFTFGTSWVSPPQTTAQSAKAAWYIAQAFLGTDQVTRAYALAPGTTYAGDASALAELVAAAREQAGTELGSDVLTTKAIALVGRWYGTNFVAKGGGLPFSPVPCGINSNWGLTIPQPQTTADLKQQARNWQSHAQCMNQRNALDYAYYTSETLMIGQWQPEQTGGTTSAVGMVYSPFNATVTGTFLAAMPDTCIVGLAELACLVVLGLVPAKGADHVALHYMMSLAWLWRRGQSKDQLAGLPFLTSNHPNFSRIIGLLSHRLKATHVANVKAMKKSAAVAVVATTKKAAAAHALEARASSKALEAPVHVSSQTTTLVAAPVSHSLRDLALAFLGTVAATAVVGFWKRRTRRK